MAVARGKRASPAALRRPSAAAGAVQEGRKAMATAIPMGSKARYGRRATKANPNPNESIAPGRDGVLGLTFPC
jgi:hypothetical protein